jgi:hypothetical protein
VADVLVFAEAAGERRHHARCDQRQPEPSGSSTAAIR